MDKKQVTVINGNSVQYLDFPHGYEGRTVQDWLNNASIRLGANDAVSLNRVKLMNLSATVNPGDEINIQPMVTNG